MFKGGKLLNSYVRAQTSFSCKAKIDLNCKQTSLNWFKDMRSVDARRSTLEKRTYFLISYWKFKLKIYKNSLMSSSNQTTNPVLTNFCYYFFQLLKSEKKKLFVKVFLTNKNFVFFFNCSNWEILVYKIGLTVNRICRFLVWFDELITSHIENPEAREEAMSEKKDRSGSRSKIQGKRKI